MSQATEAIAALEALDDFQVVQFFNRFAGQLFEDLETEPTQLISLIPQNARETDTFDSAVGALKDEAMSKATLEFNEAASFARATLQALAVQPTCAPVLSRMLKDWRNERQPAELIMQVGYAAAMILVAATTHLKLEYKDGKVIFALGKDAPSAAIVSAVMNPLAECASQLKTAITRWKSNKT